MAIQVSRNTAVLTALLLFSLPAGCHFANYEAVEGSGAIQTEARDVGGFSAIQLDGVGMVIVTLNGQETLSITADDNILPLLISEIEDGTLHLRVEDERLLNPSQPIRFAIDAKSLDRLTINGAGSIRASGIQGPRLIAAVNGVGDILAAGSVDALEVSVSGTGGFRGDELSAKKAEVALSGTGDISVRANETLDIQLSGTGSVTYLGEAKVTQSNSGVGEIRKRE